LVTAPREPFDERFVTSLIVGETLGGAVGQPMGVEMVFRHRFVALPARSQGRF
jgi:hypothetical protein